MYITVINETFRELSVKIFFLLNNEIIFLQTKKGKALTKGAKQITEENTSTLSFYTNMALGAMGIYFAVTTVLFEFTTLTIVSSNS